MPFRRKSAPSAFGDWNAQISVEGVHTERDTNLSSTVIMEHMEERVIGVNVQAEWEQEQMRAIIPLEDNLKTKDIASVFKVCL